MPRPRHNDNYDEVARFQHPDGPLILITQRKGERKHSFSILKTFENDERQIAHTAYLNRRHIPAIRELLDKAEEWLDQEVERTAAAKAVAR